MRQNMVEGFNPTIVRLKDGKNIFEYYKEF